MSQNRDSSNVTWPLQFIVHTSGFQFTDICLDFSYQTFMTNFMSVVAVI